jgi:asparagine synthase (glutamine-hydrolysing)
VTPTSAAVFHLSARLRRDRQPAEENVGHPVSDGHFAVEAHNLHPEAQHIHRDGKTLILWGNPIVDGRVDHRATAELITGQRPLKDVAREINGSFLIFIYDPEAKTLSVINDRFASLALYYRNGSDDIRFSTSFKSLLDILLRDGTADIAPEAAFEFLYFRRLFGAHTYERSIRYLDSASILTVAAQDTEPRIEKYWLPSFDKTLTAAKASEELADALKSSMAAHMSDDRSFGLMLSGGLDSRALLAAAPRPPICFTSGLTRNNEFDVAAEVAAACGAEHIFMRRPDDMLNTVVDDAVWLAGMQIYPEFQFAPFRDTVAPKANTVFLGLALDVFFAGLYQPKKPLRIAGRDTLMYKLQPLGDDLADAFMTGVSYRLKTSNPWDIVKASHRVTLTEALRHSVTTILDRAKSLGADRYGQWEYMHLHNFSRHYSFPMAASIRGWADCRIPALENRLFDLAFAISPRDKANWRVLTSAIELCNLATMRIRNANTNISARRSLAMQTAIHWSRSALNRAVRARFRTLPPWWERSWPPARHAFEHNPYIRDLATGLPDSPALQRLGFIDIDRVRSIVAQQLDGSRDHSILINLLITLERCLTPRA